MDYLPVKIDKLSKSQISKLKNGHSVRVKLGSDHTIHLSKEQYKKFNRAKAKGQALTITFDPYQRMHGGDLWGDIGHAFSSAGKVLASELIHKGIPLVSGALGSAVGSLSGPVGSIAGEAAGAYGGHKLANYVGDKTGYGLSQEHKQMITHELKKYIPVKLHKVAEELVHEVGEGLKKRGRPRKHHLKGGTALIDTPFTFRGMTDSISRASANPLGTIGYGLKKRGRPRKHKIHGGTALIDTPFTFRGMTDQISHASHDPLGTIGYGLKKRGRPRKHKAASLEGLGLKKKRVHHKKKGGALYPAGY